MNFLNPLFLFGVAAAAIPIVIHLFTRRRPREVRFSSLEFLSEVHQSEIRRLKLRQWLLLLLRALAVAALALAMARPALRGSAGGDRASTTVVVLVDRSGSMGAEGATAGAGTVMVDARRAVEDLFATLGAADEVLLVPYDRAPHPVTEQPSSDLPHLRAALQSLEPGAATTDHDAALALAARTLAASHALNRELFWISDFQAAGFRGADSALAHPEWTGVRAYLVPTPPASRANAALTDAALAPAGGSDASGAALAVTGASFGHPAGDLALRVTAGDRELGRGFLGLAASGEVSTLLPLSATPDEGGAVALPADALPLDDVRWFAAGRSGTLRVVLREDGGPSPLALALLAGSPASGIAVDVADAASLPAKIADADVLVLSGVERLGPAELQAVLDYVRGGGALLLALDARADAAFWNGSVLRELGAGLLGPVETAATGAAWRLNRAVAGHAVLAGFPARPGEPLSSARFRMVRGFRPGANGRALLRFDEAHAALIEAPRAMVLTALLTPEASDFAVSGAFLPLAHQAVKVLARGTAAASLVPGERWSSPARTGTWRIEDAMHREIPSELRAESGSTRLVSAPIERPGLYRVMADGKLRTAFAVNPDVRESDLTPLPEGALLAKFPPGRASVLRPGADLARRVREARYGRELWPWFVVLALLLLAAETAIARWGMGDPAAAEKKSAA